MKTVTQIRVAICSSLLAATTGAQSLHFNDAWWEKAMDSEKSGFIWGYLDSPCIPPVSASGMDYQLFLNDYLPKHPTTTVPVAMHVAAVRMKPTPVLKGGEVWTDAHGFMDGGWWGDSTHGNPDEHRGYVEGYMNCRIGHVSADEVDRYVKSINHYYDSPKHEHTKIAYVLEPLLLARKRDN